MIPNCSYIPGKYSADLAVLSRCLSKAFAGKQPLSQALISLAERRRLKKIGPALRLVSLKLQIGRSAFDAFSEYEKCFGTFFCHAVKHGESSGNPGIFFASLADYFDKNNRFRKKILLRLKYPAIIIIGATGVIISLLAFMIPAAARTIPAHSIVFPSATRIALQVLTLKPHVLLGFLMVVVSLLISAWCLRKKHRLEIPVFGDISRMNSLRRSALGLSFLLSNGVSPSAAAEITAASIRRSRYFIKLFKAQEKAGNGSSPAAALTDFNGIFPQTVLDTLSSESDPRSEGIRFRKIADFYEEEIEASVIAIALLCEPLIIAITGLLGGGILAALYLPLIRHLVVR
jgi:type IV pilus assembly protein PilC